MKVLKFGGTSLEDAERIQNAASIVQRTEGRLLVVLSANGGVTDELFNYAEELQNGEYEKAIERLDGLEFYYRGTLVALVDDHELRERTLRRIRSHLVFLRTFSKDIITRNEKRVIGAQGEILSTLLFEAHLKEKGENVGLLSALETVLLDENGEADHRNIREAWEERAEPFRDDRVILTQGFIGRDDHGLIADLGRGGSDHTATLFGAALDAEEVQIWSDIDGIHNNDPREVSGTFPIPQLSYEEAAELAYFGAKVLHPTAVAPAKEKEIPIRLLNSLEPSATGTLIQRGTKAPPAQIKAIAAKDGITGIRIHSGRMLMAYGFLKEVFAIFEKYRTPIDMISTSEVAVSLTIDDTTHLERIVEELNRLGAVDLAENQSIVCVVGDLGSGNAGTAARIFEAIGSIPLRMISYGGSMNNISFLVDRERKRELLNQLQEKLFVGSKKEFSEPFEN